MALAQSSPGIAGGGGNIRVTNDQGSAYVSADVLGGTGSYTDSTLARCGVDRRMQNEPTIAIDPRDTRVRTSGSNDYCAVPTNHDAWAGFYRSQDGGVTWVNSLLPGYALDASPQGLSSPVHQMTLGGAIAAGDPVQGWDTNGNLFYMGNNFNRGIQNGNSNEFRDNTGDVWVATYAPASSSTLTDGSRYVRTVLLATNTFGLGSFNDKTGIQVDQTGSPFSGTVYAAWSDFHGFGCNEIDISRSTDHGATFTIPMKISSSICNNQGPNIAIGPQGQVYVSWFGQVSGTKGQNTKTEGMAFVASADGGRSFSMANVVVPFNPFVSGAFSGNGARQCGDAPFNCPTGETFPRFDLAQPSLTTDGDSVDAVFMARLATGQGQTQFVRSHDGGATWSAATAVDPQAVGHQFFPWITASGGRLSSVYYDSRLDSDYSPDRAPCNSATGAGSNCLAVWYSTSTDGGATWSHVQLTDTLTNPNFEQFGGRRVPFFGDYIMVAAVGGSIQAVWTDSRNVVAGTELAGKDNDGDDVAGDPETGGACTSSFTTCFDATGGLDQNIYSQIVSS
ncbi:MAG TPA: sialidase family protein [Candidatus Dormibacteraeota bacterium]|nr:sialidase family protein [Candidatus Dormibacteraeota bacterium]